MKRFPPDSRSALLHCAIPASLMGSCKHSWDHAPGGLSEMSKQLVNK